MPSTANDNIGPDGMHEEPNADLYCIHSEYLNSLKEGEPITITDDDTGYVQEFYFTSENISSLHEEGWYYWFQYKGFGPETVMVGPFETKDIARRAGEYAWEHDELELLPQTKH